MAGGTQKDGGESVHDSLVGELSQVYLQVLTKLNSGLASILRRSRAEKSEPLLIWADDGDVLMKAANAVTVKKPAPAGKVGKVPKGTKPKAEWQSMGAKPAAVPGGAKDKREEVKKPGSRGGHFYRDDKGHVKYGDRPTGRYNKQVSDEEAENLYSRLETVSGYSPKLDKFVAKAAGWDTDDMRGLIDTARMVGQTPHDLYVQSIVEGGGSAEDADESWGQLMGAYQSALEDPAILKLAKNVIKEKKDLDEQVTSSLKENNGLTKNFDTEFLTGNADSVALKTLGSLYQLKTVFLPTSRRDLGEGASKKDVGFLRTADATLDRLQQNLSEMTPAQQMNWAVGERLRTVLNADEDEAAEVAFKDPDGNFTTTTPAEFDDILFSAMEAKSGNKLSDAEKEHVKTRINEVASKISDLVQAYNENGAAGAAVGMLFRGEVTPKELFKDGDVLKEVKQKIEDRENLVEAALKARDDPDFKVSPQMQKGFDAMATPANPKPGLFDYQKKIVNWMLTVKRGLLAADTGTGKTPMLIAAMSNLLDNKKIKRGILILPKSLVMQWPKEIQRFRPGAKVVTMGEGMTQQDRLDTLEAVKNGDLEADFVIMSASTVDFTDETSQKLKDNGTLEKNKEGMWQKKKGMSDEDYEAALAEVAKDDPLVKALKSLDGAVVFDEAHHSSQGLKERTNVHHQVAKAMLEDREYTWLATATPMPNGKPHELFNLMNLAHPGSAGESEKKFENAVATYDKVPNPETGELEEKLVAMDDWSKMSESIKPFVYSKDKNSEDVVASAAKQGQALKPANHQEHTLGMPPEVDRLYKQAGKLVPHDAGPDYKPFNELSQMGQKFRALDQMQKIAITPKLVLGDAYNGPQPKIEHCTDLVLKHFSIKGNEDKPIVIFSAKPSAFKYLKEEMAKKGIDPSLVGEIYSGVPQSERDITQEAVNAGKLKIVLIGVQSGGAGLNLQKAANKIIFLDKPWSPADVDQAVGRVHRTGQKDNVDVIHMKMQGALDEDKLKNLRKKIMTTKAAIESSLGEDHLAEVTTASMIKLLGSDGDEVKLDPVEIQSRLDKLGLKGVVAASSLQGKFDRKQFSKTVEFKGWKDQGGAFIDQMDTLNDVRLKKKKIDKATYDERKAKIGRQRLIWESAVHEAGKEEVATPKGRESAPPEREFVSPKGKNPLNPGTMEHAVLQSVIDKKVRTTSDLVDKVLIPGIQKEGAEEGDIEKMRPRLNALAKKKFAELQKLGYLAPKTGAGRGDEPVPKQAHPKGGASESVKPAKAKRAPEPTAPPKINPLKDKLTISAKSHPKLKGDAKAVWSEWLRTKPKSFDDAMVKIADGDKGLRGVLKECIETYIKLGLIS